MPQFARQPPPPYPDNVPMRKGALVSVDGIATTPVHFQYNPAAVRRSIRPNQVGATDTDRSTAIRFSGAAVEIIHLEAHIDVIDELSKTSGKPVNRYGANPLLAQLQLLAYPTTLQVRAYEATLASGSVDVVPPLAPRLLFVWGPNRVVPVRLASMAVTEEMFDPNLNPVAATVALEMRVLSYSDVSSTSGDYTSFIAYQRHLELMAATQPDKS